VVADALKTVFGLPAAEPAPDLSPVVEGKPAVSRRGFFRRLAGKRN
jgi:hypothetical protein